LCDTGAACRRRRGRDPSHVLGTILAVLTAQSAERESNPNAHIGRLYNQLYIPTLLFYGNIAETNHQAGIHYISDPGQQSIFYMTLMQRWATGREALLTGASERRWDAKIAPVTLNENGSGQCPPIEIAPEAGTGLAGLDADGH
jgi:hypothetical protein